MKKNSESLTEQIVTKVVECRAAGYLPKRLFISYDDLKKLSEEKPEVAINGDFFGLNIILLPEGCKAQVRPEEMKR